MSGHTPAPWRFRKCPCGDPICDRYRIAHAGAEGMFSLDDARLIASAPKLLALLEELIDIEGPQPGTAEWARKVQAAIAEATHP